MPKLKAAAQARGSAVTARFPVHTKGFVIVCATAGALAVPLHPVASPVSALVAGLVGLLGLRVWRWSGLPSSMKTEARCGVAQFFPSAVSLGLGLIVGLMLLGVIRLGIEPAVPAIGARMAEAAALSVWRRILIIYVAAVGEELVFRLLLLSLVAGLTVRLFRFADRVPNRTIIWASTAIAAFAFAVVHLPVWRGEAPLDLSLAFAVVTLNAVGGVVFGYVFVTRGIVAAMWAHAGANCATQLIGPLTG